MRTSELIDKYAAHGDSIHAVRQRVSRALRQVERHGEINAETLISKYMRNFFESKKGHRPVICHIRNEAQVVDSDSVGVSQVEGGAVAASDDDDDGGDDDGESDRRHSLRSYSRNTPVLPPAVANFDSLPSQARLRTSEVLILMGLSRTTLHRRVIAQAFPPPRKTPTGQNYWTADDVRRALAQS